MYERDVGTGKVGWDPKYPDLAADVMANHPECPVDLPADVKAEAPIQLDDQCAAEINETYVSRVEADPDLTLGPE
jgi:hypothetical protein